MEAEARRWCRRAARSWSLWRNSLVTNSHGSVTSSNAVFTVLIPPTIVLPPTGQKVYIGATVLFSVTAQGTAPLSYQWAFNGAYLPGQTSSTFTIASAATNH